MKSRLCSALAFAVAALLALAGCGGDDTKADAGATADAAKGADIADAQSSEAGPTDAASDGAASKCGALPQCLNAAGQEDLALCPKPVSDYACVAGCCKAKFFCKVDQDCADKVGVEAGCPSKELTCGCDTENSVCIQTACAADAQCPKGKVCQQGGCKDPLPDTGLVVKLLRPVWITTPGKDLEPVVGLGAQASDGKGNVKLDATFEWKLADGTAFKLEGGKLKAGDVAGKQTITASSKGSAASNAASLWNLGPIPAGKVLRVTAIDDFSWAPLAGKVVVVGLSDQPTPAAAVAADLADGQATFADVKFPCDIHLIGKDHQPVSVMRYQPAGATGEVLLPSALYHYAQLEFDGAGKLVKEKSKIVQGDAVKGAVDYPGVGEAMLGLTSLAFGPQLLNFSIDAILGPNVRRPFDPKAPSFVNPDPGKPQEIPGGVTFALGTPVVTHFVVAGPPGVHTMWTLGGRLALSQLLSEVGKIFDSVDGGLDVGQIVSVLLPYLGGFSSDVQFGVQLGASLTEPLKELPLIKPKYPLLLKTSVELSPLPKAGAAFADVAFIIGGAMMPIGEIVPLGLTAGADTASKEEKPDGLVDGNADEKGNQPVKLTVAPLHSGLQVGPDNHVIVTAAVVVGGKGKKEGGSIIIGAPGPVGAVTKPGEFLALPEGSTFDPAAGKLTVKAVAGAHVYRTTLVAPEGRQWQLLVPKAWADKAITLPDLASYGNDFPVAKTKRAFVGALEFKAAADVVDLLLPGGLDDIVRKVTRTAFTDANP
ncbi:MAG: hypothetical protein FJ100_14390 [Deltaproteobacteria bacterium]|nr:hypothetical protein [Deltaproteobacteria bacterium]